MLATNRSLRENAMANVDMSITLPASAAAVWDAIGDFDGLHRWHPAVASSERGEEKGSRVRRLSLQGGGQIVEVLEGHDDRGRKYSYAILSGPLPVSSYRSELAVREDGADRCTVEWSSRFDPVGGEKEAVEAIRGVYQAGFDGLKKRFGG
jgi:Polyketide cyclase / dehydrase and lipid transport